MRALNRKLFRELMEMSGQALAIVMVIASGVATYLMSVSTLEALQETRARYYEEYAFADVFGSLTRAPRTLRDRIAEIPGVGSVALRVVAAAQIDVPDFPDPVVGHLVSVPESGQPLLNRIHLRRGRMIEPWRDDEILVSEAFASAHGLLPGDQLSAVIKGTRKKLNIVGVALSPEYIYQIAPGRILPDFKRYAVIWMGHRALAAAYEMEDAFNSVTLGLAADANADTVIERLDVLLEPYGGLGAYDREDQISHRFLNEEFEQLRQTSGLFSAIFLAVTAFLLNVVVARLVNTQREQIAILKAFGYSNLQVGWHYVSLVLLIVAGGVIAGSALGAWLGRGLSGLYMDYYRFPFLDYGIDPVHLVLATLVTAFAAVLGTLGAVRRAVVLPPAEAMRPEAPEAYRPALVERLGTGRWLDQPTRMILRHVERRPVKSALTVMGISMACAIMMVGTFFTDSIDYMVYVEFDLAQREDMSITFFDPTSRRVVHDLRTLDGIQHVEPFRTVAVRLRAGPRSYRTSILGYERDAVLHRALDERARPLDLPGKGLLLTDQLAEILGVRPGEDVTVQVLEGKRLIRTVPVVGTVRQYIGIGAYMTLDGLNRLIDEGEAVSGAFVSIDEAYRDAIYAEIKEMPRVAGTEAADARVENFYESMGQFLLTYMGFISALSGAIVFGIVYNSARIALAERSRELASLRVLGFTRGEASYILLGELGLLTLVAIPLGFLVGRRLCQWMIDNLPHELFRIPLVLQADTYALAATVVLLSATVSGLVVRRRVDHLDLVAVLKTRE
ncbi:MAG: FtsX-like permease family protein [Gammaproteobacteria bacterium]